MQNRLINLEEKLNSPPVHAWLATLEAQWPIPPNARSASVLIPLLYDADHCHILLTQRHPALTVHPGQICFPGGHCEATDPNFWATATRETFEEIGLSPEGIIPVGTLGTWPTHTGYAVHVCIGKLAKPITLQLDTREVTKVIYLPLDFLLQANFKRVSSSERLTHWFELTYENDHIWGFTASMLYLLQQIMTVV